MWVRLLGISARNSRQIRWTFCRYHNLSVFNRLIVFVHSVIHSPMSINIFFEEIMDFFPNISYQSNHRAARLGVVSRLLTPFSLGISSRNSASYTTHPVSQQRIVPNSLQRFLQFESVTFIPSGQRRRVNITVCIPQKGGS